MSMPANLLQYPLVYLASPYTKYPAGIGKAFYEAAKVAARLIKDGVTVYSPITHTHPIATHGGIDPYALDIWMPYNLTMMRKSEALCVAMIVGWDVSVGVAAEIKWFSREGKPVFYLDIKNWQINHEPER